MAAGRKTGGRTKGTPNKATAAKAAEIAASGLTPLDYLLTVMRDEEAELHVRLDAAKGAAPYVHPKLAAITHTGKDGGPLEIGTTETREVSVRDMAKAWLAMFNRPEDDDADVDDPEGKTELVGQ